MEETIKERIDRLGSMKIEKVSDRSGEDICNTHDKHRIISNSFSK